MKTTRKPENRGGFALLLVLGISLALFSLASLALAANCRFRMQNRQMLIDLRERASRLRIQPMEKESVGLSRSESPTDS
jgi:hypothetical protein